MNHMFLLCPKDKVSFVVRNLAGILAFMSAFVMLMATLASWSPSIYSFPEPVFDPPAQGDTYSSKIAQKLTVKFEGISEEESSILKGKELDYYIFVLENSKMYYWGEILEKRKRLSDVRTTSWRNLIVESEDDDGKPVGEMLVPDSGDCKIILLFLRGKKHEPDQYFLPDETTEYAYRELSPEDLGKLIHKKFWSSNYISYKDLNLDFKSEEYAIQNDMLYLLVSMAFSRPDNSLVMPGTMVSYSNKYITYRENCRDYVDHLDERRKSIGKKTINRKFSGGKRIPLDDFI